MTNNQVENLPIIGRNVYTLLALTPGVQSSSFANNVIGIQQQVTMINGGTENSMKRLSFSEVISRSAPPPKRVAN